MITEDIDTYDVEIKLLLEGIYLRYRADFRDYSLASMRRRIRLSLDHFKCETVSDLQKVILHQPLAFDQLLQYLTVNTSEMFRDPEYFMALRKQVFPVLATYPSIKIWIAGCSTGEELYSMAILLKEEGLLERTIFYATDINPMSLKRAERGVFPVDQIRHYTQNYQASGGKLAFSDYYATIAGENITAIFDKSLRANVVFADHSLTTDSVFGEMHFISCRNVMIYFNRDLQKRVLNLFDASLAYRGFLGLGSKESLFFSDIADGYEPVHAKMKIYRKKGGSAT